MRQGGAGAGMFVRKEYLVLTRSTVAVGTHTHMLLEDGRVMRAVDDEDEGGKESTLQVTACRCIPREQLSDQAQAMCQGGLFESAVVLVTGRRHQIRAQFAAMGVALVGDARYGDGGGSQARSKDAVNIGLHAARLEFEVEDSNAPLGREQGTHHAAASAPPPWWWRHATPTGH